MYHTVHLEPLNNQVDKAAHSLGLSYTISSQSKRCNLFQRWSVLLYTISLKRENHNESIMKYRLRRTMCVAGSFFQMLNVCFSKLSIWIQKWKSTCAKCAECKSSETDNLKTTKGSQNTFPFSENMEATDLIRKRKLLYAEVTKMFWDKIHSYDFCFSI